MTPRGLRRSQVECDGADVFAEHVARQMSQIAAEIEGIYRLSQMFLTLQRIVTSGLPGSV